MEHARGEVIIQRALAVLLLAAVVAVAVLERGSPLARAAATGRPWAAWLALAGGPEHDAPLLYLAVYNPRRRLFDLVYVAKPARSAYDKALTQGEPAFLAAQRMADAAAAGLPVSALEGWDWSNLPLVYEKAPLPGAAEPADWAKTWLLERLAWPKLWRRSRGLSPFDRLLFWLELRRLEPNSIRPAWLPEESQKAAFFARLLTPETAAAPAERPLTIEVFNCSGAAGLASQAKKILRLKGADVVATGNSDVLEDRTIVYDRTGRHEDAQTVRAMLGCDSALAVTQIDPKRLVDVSLLLADDCPLQ